MLMIKMTCRCGQSLAIVGDVPMPGTTGDYFAALDVHAVADLSLPVGPDAACPTCGTDIGEQLGGEDEAF